MQHSTVALQVPLGTSCLLLFSSAGICKSDVGDKNCAGPEAGNCPRSPKELCLMDRDHECCTDCDCSSSLRCKGATCDPCTRKCSGWWDLFRLNLAIIGIYLVPEVGACYMNTSAAVRALVLLK